MDTTLVILAAGLSSRFGSGSPKQVAAVGRNGEIIADYSVFDAIRAGFTKIVYVIREDLKEAFVENVSSKIKVDGVEVVLAFQKMDDVPQGFSAVEREKPWGTAHALWAARHVVNEPMMMIHGDDFYGADVYGTVNNFLRDPSNGEFDYAMGGYRLENTLSPMGGVSRGVCVVKDGLMTDMRETHKIRMYPDGIAYPDPADEEQERLIYLPGSSIVSMGAFAFKPSIFGEIEKDFVEFLGKNPQNPKTELWMTGVVSKLLTSGKATMKVLETTGKWFGVTYQEDKPAVVAAIADLVEQGVYPDKLF